MAIEETIWPTRCAICDKPNFLLCPQCASKILFIDQTKSCKICGEPFAKIQCCGCRINLSFKKCISSTILNEDTGKIITLYKDAGERRLSSVMAYFMSKSIPPSWINNHTFITYIPSTKSAIRKRGFDHGMLLATEISKIINLPVYQTYTNPENKDQRKLNRKQREQNLEGKFNTLPICNKLLKNNLTDVIIIDDVYTTGSTLNNASSSLKKFGFELINCITFSRTF